MRLDHLLSRDAGAINLGRPFELVDGSLVRARARLETNVDLERRALLSFERPPLEVALSLRARPARTLKSA